MIGGLLSGQEIIKTVLKIDLVAKTVIKCADMISSKCVIAVCCVGHKIYTAGGYPYMSCCESYNTLSDSWAKLPALPCAGQGITMVPIKKRYLYTFGGPKSANFPVFRMDLCRMSKGWYTIPVQSSTQKLVWMTGVLPLGESDGYFEFLVFGGETLDNRKL